MAGIDDTATYPVTLPAEHNFPLACPGILSTVLLGGRVVMAPSPEPGTALALALNLRLSAEKARAQLGWARGGPSVLDDLESGSYAAERSLQGQPGSSGAASS